MQSVCLGIIRDCGGPADLDESLSSFVESNTF